MKVLVLTSEAITAQQLREALPAEIDPQKVEVMVVAPALQESPIKFWFSDADDAIKKAELVRRESVERLGDAGVSASGDTGESDPMKAIEDALNTFDAERIVIFTHAPGDQHYKEDVDEGEIEQRFGLPVVRARVTRGSA